MENQNNSTPTNTYKTTNNKLVTGMFRDRESTENAYNALHEKGYNQDEVHLLMSDDTRKKHFADDDTEIGTKAAEGLGKGAAIGGTVGAVAGAIAAIGTSLLIPGLGLVIAGPLAAGLAGAGAGSITGGIVGTLVGAGIPEERARIYEDGIKKGNIVVGVHPRNDEDAEYFKNNWKEHKGEEIHH
ncbi:general stress protein [Cytophaga aurantiaca]|uniref:general stress protein n=1 Tax=Cytophaga aurantiaca TaxID=29530 RepID=UPI00035E2DF7|nr:general stress protein [Cytophaga aurantiaca]